MFERFIGWFSKHHLLTNIIAIVILAGGIISWNITKKEEMPDITFPVSRITVNWSGASPEDMARYVTTELEDALSGVDGIEEMNSSTTTGSTTIRLSLPIKANKAEIDEIISDIEDAVDDAQLPSDIDDEPRVFVPETSKKPVIEASLYKEGSRLLTDEERIEIQRYSATLENMVTSLPTVSSVNWRNNKTRQVMIYLNVEALKEFNISISEVSSAIKAASVRTPVGTMKAKWETKNSTKQLSDTEDSPKVTLDKRSYPTNIQRKYPATKKMKTKVQSGPKDYKITVEAELIKVEDLENFIVRTGYDGGAVRLKDIARIVLEFEEVSEIYKMNGYEAVTMIITKSSDSGILTAVEEIKKCVSSFESTTLSGTDIKVVIGDDESISVKNRLSMVTSNGILGFILILIILFVFLNIKSSIWVAFGIPFTLCFSLVAMNIMGFTINNITLSAIIIVLGMVVDDAIVVAENITRFEQNGMPRAQAVVEGTGKMFLPILASIVTTCIAFVPLFFFGGRFGLMNAFIPPVIFMMLAGSLFESIFILPSHMGANFFGRTQKTKQKKWFIAIENGYQKYLSVLLHHRKLLFSVSILLLVSAGFIFKTSMRYEMFPREESTQLRLEGEVPFGTLKDNTAQKAEDVERIIDEYLGGEVLSYVTSVAQGRRGSSARENVFSVSIELVPLEDRTRKSSAIQKEIEQKMANLSGFENLSFSAFRFGSSSGNAIEIQVKENNETTRLKLAQELIQEMQNYPEYANAELERQLRDPEYVISPKRDTVGRLGITANNAASILRTAVNGTTLYEVPDGDDDIAYKITVEEEDKKNIKKILDIPVINTSKYLVPLRNLVNVVTRQSPNTISSVDGDRTTKVYADMAKTSKLTPVETAEYFETTVFPKLLAKYPTSALVYSGEVEDTRDSTGEFLYSIIVVVLLIYIILVLLFNSLVKPFLIMITIPFAAVGVIFALKLHGISVYGFFSVIGCLGLAGVVVNDSIVMISTLEDTFTGKESIEETIKEIAEISKTRLRAVILTTITTVAGLMPTAYGIMGYDSMLSDMMLVMSWGLIFATMITLILVPVLYMILHQTHQHVKRGVNRLKGSNI